METFTELKALSDNPNFHAQRQSTLDELSDDVIDLPMVDLINGLNQLPYCFTLQSCYGHFVFNGQKDSHSLEPLKRNNPLGKATYRIAYIALCIENSLLGESLLANLKGITAMDRQNIQFCCADWFWRRQVNSYALQVMPDRFKCKDSATIDIKEALQIEKIKKKIFIRIYDFIK